MGSGRMNNSDAKRPAVSICIPTYNGAAYLAEALQSAVSQTFDDLEILVVDGGSTDGTVAVASSQSDPRIRVVATERNDGMVANWNRTVQLSRGRYVKFLFQDDLLAPTCIERMLGVFERNPSVGLVFSPRDIVVQQPHDPYTRSWLEHNKDVHLRLGHLNECNDGHALVMSQARDRFRSNCFGEPTCVMIERSRFERVGLFNLRMRQLVDVEMWYRVLYGSDAGFVDERLASFRVHGSAVTASNLETGMGWMDHLWIVEGMLRLPNLSPEDRRRFGHLRRSGLLMTTRHQVWRVWHRRRLSIVSDSGSLRDYVAYRFEVSRGRDKALHGELR